MYSGDSAKSVPAQSNQMRFGFRKSKYNTLLFCANWFNMPSSKGSIKDGKANEAKAKLPAKGRRKVKTSQTMPGCPPEKLQTGEIETLHDDIPVSETEELDPDAVSVMIPPTKSTEKRPPCPQSTTTKTTEELPSSSKTTKHKAKITKKKKKKDPQQHLERTSASDSDQSEASYVDESQEPPPKRSKKFTVPIYLSNEEEADMVEWLKDNPAIYDK